MKAISISTSKSVLTKEAKKGIELSERVVQLVKETLEDGKTRIVRDEGEWLMIVGSKGYINSSGFIPVSICLITGYQSYRIPSTEFV